MNHMLELLLLEKQKQEMQKLISCNYETKKYGLVLSVEDARGLLTSRRDSLKENQRIEFGEGVMSRIIYAFCNSNYMNQDNYVDTLEQLQAMFYLYKNEAQDELSDEELINFMRRQFDEVCFGDLEYLKSTCLERFARAIRSGYQCKMSSRLRDEYALQDTENEYCIVDEETRWEYEVFKMKLEDLF